MKRSMVAMLFVGLLVTSRLALAGPFADDMAKCLVNSTSPQDRTLLVKWIFSVMASHPDLSTMSSVSAKQRDDLTKNAGALFERLLTEACRSQTEQAIQNEGPQTIQYAFQVLGQVATMGLFSDPHVAENMKGLAKYVDEQKIKGLGTSPSHN